MNDERQKQLDSLRREYRAAMDRIYEMESVPLSDDTELPQQFWQEMERLRAQLLQLTIEITRLEGTL